MKTAALAIAMLALTAGSASAAKPTGFFGCRTYVAKHPLSIVRPRTIVVACADGNFYLTGIRWSAWAATRADGTATAHANDCDPYCAAGHFHTYPAAVTLSRPRSCKGARVFTEIAWRFTGPKPTSSPRTGTTSFSCSS